MPTTTYTTIDGQIVSENRAGTQKFYGPDPLGSVVTIYDTAGTVTDTFTYWPYGEIRTSSGSTATPFKFCGTWGYYSDATGRLYVRARFYRDKIARWQTVDPLWPSQRAYTYCGNLPSMAIDPSGLLLAAIPIGVWIGGLLIGAVVVHTYYQASQMDWPTIDLALWSSPQYNFPPTSIPVGGGVGTLPFPGTQYPAPIGPGLTIPAPPITFPPFSIPTSPRPTPLPWIDYDRLCRRYLTCEGYRAACVASWPGPAWGLRWQWEKQCNDCADLCEVSGWNSLSAVCMFWIEVRENPV